MSRNVYLGTLAALLAALWVALAFHPFDRSDWWLENVLLFAAVGLLVSTHRAFPLSKVSYTTIFVFLCLHTVGAHYTYAEVPYDEAWRNLTGHSFNSAFGWTRNNFDRVVHFSYGLLLAYPIREVFIRVANVRGFMLYGDYRQPNPPAAIVRAVAAGEIDVGLVWGPLAGYFAARSPVPLRLQPVTPWLDDASWPMVYDISVGVQRDNARLLGEVDHVLADRRAEIEALLDRYRVPRANP